MECPAARILGCIVGRGVVAAKISIVLSRWSRIDLAPFEVVGAEAWYDDR
jgi:hypothetical protein